ncbi:SpoIIE family protein phosphatase [Streptomyces sp. NPDC001970]
MAARVPIPVPKDLAGILQSAVGVTGAALGSLLTRSALGLAVWDADLRCTWVNDTLEHYDGIPGHQRLGRRPGAALPGDAGALERVMRQVLATGTAVVGREYRVPAVHGAHRNRALSASFVPLDDGDGRALGVALVVVQITGRRWAGDRLALLNEAGARIGTTLDVMRTGQELADFAVPFLADYVTVDLADSVRLGEEPLARIGPNGGRIPAFRRAGMASIHTGAPESLWHGGEVVYVPPTSPFTQVLSSGRSVLEPVLDTSWLDEDPARAEKIHEFGMHSLMVVPVRARGVLLGVAVFVRTDNPAPFDEDDLLLAEDLVSRAALSLDNARRYTRERATALALQRSLLPQRVNGGPAVEVACRYLPAEVEDGVGGDWFDVIPLPRGRVALVVGDVVGHGIGAAATMGRLRTAVRTLADLDLPPDELLTSLDRTVVRLAEEECDSPDTPARIMSATCLYAVYDPATRLCTMARAGHLPPTIVHPDGSVTLPDLPAGPPLGIGLLPYETGTVELPEGSVIALYTDGLVEDRHDDIDVGMDRVSAALAQPGLPLEDLCSAVIDTLPATTSHDDVTLLLARTRSPAPASPAGTPADC